MLKFAAQLFDDARGGAGLDNEAVQGALGRLIGEGENLDLPGFAASMQSGGLGSVLSSWLARSQQQ